MKGFSAFKITLITPSEMNEDERVMQDIDVVGAFGEFFDKEFEFLDGLDDINEDDNGIVTSTWYLFLPDSQYDNIEGFYNKVRSIGENWIKPIEDITDEILLENKYFELGDMIKEYSEQNLSKDDVLDKINSFGFENLSDIDKKILNS